MRRSFLNAFGYTSIFSAIGLLLDISVYASLVKLLHSDVLYASIVGSTVAVTFVFFTVQRLVFRDRELTAVKYALWLVYQAAGILAFSRCVQFVYEGTGHLLLAKIATVPLSFTLNYLVLHLLLAGSRLRRESVRATEPAGLAHLPEISWRQARRLSWLVPGLLGAALLLYIFTAMRVVHHHESAYTLLYARNVLEHGPYSPTFVGREVAFVTWALVAAPVEAIFGTTLLAHSITSALFVIFTASVVLSFCRVARLSLAPAVVLATLAFLTFNVKHEPYRWFDQVWVWPMNSYGVYDLLSVLYLLAVFRLVLAPQENAANGAGILRHPGLLRALMLLGLTLCFAGNGARGIITIVLPVLFAVAMEFIYSRQLTLAQARGFVLAFMSAGAGLIAGWLLNKWAGRDAFQAIQQSHTLFSTAHIAPRFMAFLEAWYQLFDALPVEGKPIFDFSGLLVVSKFLLATALFLAPFACAGQIMREGGVLRRMVLYKHYAITAVVFFAYLYGTSHSERYLIPVAVSSFFVFAVVLDLWVSAARFGKVAAAALLLVVPYLGAMVFYAGQSSAYLEAPETALAANPNYRLAHFLVDHGFKRGFSPRWSTGALTMRMYSGGRLDIGLIDDDTFTPHWHGDTVWYQPRPGTGSFLVVSDADFENLYWPRRLVDTYKPRALRFEDQTVYLFDFDLASILRDLKTTLDCQTADRRGLSSELVMVADRPGGRLGCKGWGGTVRLDGTWVRRLNGHGQAYFAAEPGRHVVTLTAGAIGEASSQTPNVGVAVFRGSTKLGVWKFGSGMNTYSFEDNIPAGQTEVEYVLMPQSGEIGVARMTVHRASP